MRKNDIKVGGEYALVEYDGDFGKRVRVDEVGVEREVYDSRSWSRRPTSVVRDGVRVTYLSALGTPLDLGWRPAVVQSRNITRTWEQQLDLNDRKRERKVSFEKVNQRYYQLASRVRQVLGNLPEFEVAVDGSHLDGYGWVNDGIKISADNLAELVRLAKLGKEAENLEKIGGQK